MNLARSTDGLDPPPDDPNFVAENMLKYYNLMNEKIILGAMNCN
jgi:hypothetical protein